MCQMISSQIKYYLGLLRAQHCLSFLNGWCFWSIFHSELFCQKEASVGRCCRSWDFSLGHIWIRNLTPHHKTGIKLVPFPLSPKDIAYVLKNRYLRMSKLYLSHFAHRKEKKLLA